MSAQAYIDTARRSQPIAELERKARKAKRRRPLVAREEIDLDFARDHQNAKSFYNSRNPELHSWDTHYCGLCSQFGKGWDEATKSYRRPVAHLPRCSMSPVDDGPYPGWAVATRALQPSTPGGTDAV